MRLQSPERSLALAASAVVLLASHLAHAQGDAGALHPCRVLFDETTTGGDVITQRGEIRFDRSMPQRDGSLIMSGSGTATVTYRADNCAVIRGSPFTARMSAWLVSDDGANVEVDITPVDEEFPITFQCGRGTAETNVFVDGIPTVRLPLRHGASARFAEGGARGGGISGTVTLELCTADGTPPEPPANESAGAPPGAAGGAGASGAGGAQGGAAGGAAASAPDDASADDASADDGDAATGGVECGKRRRSDPFACEEPERRRSRH
jgi:hypothetical protein